MPEIQKMHKMKIVIEYKDETSLWNALEVLGGSFENQIFQMPVELGPAFRLGCGNPGKWRIEVEKKGDGALYYATKD